MDLGRRVRHVVSSRKHRGEPRSDRPEQIWAAGLDNEVQFWSNWFATKGLEWPAAYERRLQPDRPLQPELVKLITAPVGSTVRILDAGSGPITHLGSVDPGFTIELEPVDALADSYREIIAAAGVQVSGVPVKGETERLDDLFAADTFDLAFARNTIDHSYDPLLCIKQLVRCVKPGCHVVLEHLQNEAEHEQYEGLHQWNIEAGEVDATVWRPGGPRLSLAAELAPDAEILAVERMENESPPRWHRVVLRKRV